ncbi:acyltransferase family protein [Terriglobus aquaticus]|uniref:Acyltransferase family protein n=1 Tax=Terriglobus aquaticus TaxID=940139 RepID=A0ABW9KHH1_9BACT|nr:acyltransferase [Terriglobus aquaticus]
MRAPQRYVGLQVLRAIAALAVVMYHATVFVFTRLHVFFAPIWRCGSNGVDLFFVLSGFVIVLSTQRLQGTRDGWKIFAERRLTRIVPLYWIATLIKVVLLKFDATANLTSDLSFASISKAVFFLPSVNALGDIQPVLNVGWTLNMEMFFYLLFTIALFFRANVFLCVGLPLLFLSAGDFLHIQGAGTAWTFYAQSIVLEFFFGMLVALAILRGKRLPAWLAWLAVVGGLYALFALLPPVWPKEIHTAWVQGIPAALVVYGAASLEGRLPHIPAWLIFLGDASYAIYLFHGLCGQLSPMLLVKLGIPSPVLSELGTVAISLAVGSLAYLWLDLPIMRWFKQHVLFHGKPVLHVQETLPRTGA